MDCLFTHCIAKKDPLNTSSASIPLILAIALLCSGSCAVLFAQTAESNSEANIIGELALGDSTHSAQLEVYVQSVRTRPEVDSLWTDSIWQWRGTCSAPTALFHFQWYDPIDSFLTHSLVKEVQCIAEANEINNTEIKLVGEMTASVSVLYEQATDSAARPKCFPPTSVQQMLTIQQKMDETIFESEKMQWALQTINAKCLNKMQVKQLLLSIPSEDRRLDLLKKIPKADHVWTTADMKEIFQLQFIEQKALRLLDKP